jgi:hypothetical protein
VTLLIEIEGQRYTFRQMADRLKLKPNSANARLRRVQRTLGRQAVTWQELERGSRGYVYKKKLPEQYECRNAIRRMLVDRGIGFQEVAKRIKSTRQHVDRVIGTPSKKNRYALTPQFVARISAMLKLDEVEAAELQELGAREAGWRF